MTDTAPPAPPPSEPKAMASAPARRSLPRRALRWLLWIVVAVPLIEGLLWLGVPPLVRWQGQKIASQELGRPVRIGKVEFKPWSLELTVHDLAVGGEQPGTSDQLTVARIYLNASAESLWKLAPVLDALQVDDPALRLTRLDRDHYDIDDILAKLKARPKPEKPSEPMYFALYNIVLQGGRVDLDDRVAGRVQKVRDLKLALPFISDLPSAREVKVQPQLAFTLNGSPFESQAEALPFDPSKQTEARFKLSQFDFEPYLRYLPAGLPLQLKAGLLDADVQLAFGQTPKPLLRLSGTVTVSKFKAADQSGADALDFSALKIQLADVQPLARQIHLASVELDDPRVAVRRGANGAFNVLPEASATKADGTAPRPAANPADAAPAKGQDANPAPALALSIDKLGIQGGTVDWRDDAVAGTSSQPAAARLERVTLNATSIAYPLDQPFAFNGSAALAGATASATAAPAGKRNETASGSQAKDPVQAEPKAAEAPAAAMLKFDGKASLAQGEVTLHTAGLPLTLAQPYFAAYLEPQLSGTLGADLTFKWFPPKDKTQPLAWSASAARVQLDSLLLSGSGAAPRPRARSAGNGELAQVDQLQLADVQIDPEARRVTVGRIDVKEPRVTVERDAQQHWMYERWLRQPKEAETTSRPRRSSAPQHKAEPAWGVQINALALEGGTVGWQDDAASQPVRAEVTDLQVHAGKIDLDGKRPIELDVSARLGSGQRGGGAPGRLSWRGQVAWAPLSATGAIDAVRLPLQLFEPYLHDQLNIRVAQADTSFKGRVTYAESARGPRVQVEGDARVDDLRTYTRPGTAVSAESAGGTRNAAAHGPKAAPTRRAAANREQELFSAKQVRLDRLGVHLVPGRAPQIAVGGTLLSGFFARIVISPSGRINLQDIANSNGGATKAGGTATAAAPQPAETPARKPNPLAPVIRFGPTRLSAGHIDFTDHFIKPNYSADLTALNGSLGAFSSVSQAGAPQMAELKLTGTAEDTAALDVHGQINPLADPLALDIQAKVADLDLPPLSPYSIKYTGHGIERGKLSMDVAYKIQPDGQLTATNKLILNQLTFGEPVDGAPASLPVQLATALLANSDGVIDLDLPISGSINDPQFSIGPIIMKAIVNLIGKAITAPFTLLAHALGGGASTAEDMSQVVFAPGSAQLSAAARTQLDRVAKALADRPTLRLTVAGSAQLASDEGGVKRERLYAEVAGEQRPGSVTEPNAADPARIASSPDYPALLKRLYRRTNIPGKPRDFIGLQKDIPVAQMEDLLLAQMKVGPNAMRQLADQRAAAVKDYLASKGVAASRLFLGATQTGGANAPAETGSTADTAGASGSTPAWVPHAQLKLGM